MYLEGWSIHPSNSLKELHIDYQSSQCQTEIRIQYPESDNGTFGYFAIKRKRSFRFTQYMYRMKTTSNKLIINIL